MNANYTTAEYVAAGAMHTMKVLTITLLACAVTVIQPVEAQGKCDKNIHIFTNSWLIVHFFDLCFFIVTVDFAQPRYAIAENNNLTVEVRTNLEQFSPDIEFEFNVTVRVKEDLRCTRKKFGM